MINAHDRDRTAVDSDGVVTVLARRGSDCALALGQRQRDPGAGRFGLGGSGHDR
jgi:hypothetical protein